MPADRELDLVLYGATGFVGKLTAEYLAESAPEGTRIGLGGRSREKLERVREGLGAAAAEWPLVVADSSDESAVAELAGRCSAVATTVGPYRKYGMPLAEACARAGTHYADLTGEILFMRETIERLDPVARERGARIVHNCGFDSIPSDLGVLLLHEAAGELEDTTFVVRRLRGGLSGGTLDSMKGMIDEVRSDRSLIKVIGDPYALSPDRSAEPDLGDESDLAGVEHDEDLGGWFGPFIMARINTRVVRRSNALQDWAYGRRFKYREVMATGEGIGGRARALGMAGGLGALAGGLALPPTRFVLDRVLPDPGEGPKDELVRNGFYKIEIHARTPGGERWVCRVEAQGDPGYGATRVMLGEAGLCLALDEARLPDRTGVLTPATAMGDVLVERLRAAGQVFEVARG
ncbi:MAG: saccharopine dehydrogenase NADP-binding domain-containing protein [Actinomycetota bacterium]|nr:saccharopine dehydrogenase NADP-binding domain-containing protein [Actinomycetota bacterium]